MKWAAALATLLAAALAVRAAAAAAACDAEGWEPLAPEDIPDEVLNATITEFERLYVPSEDNPDNGTRLIWVVPCEPLDIEVQSACQQTDGVNASFQLVLALNCTHQTPYPHADTAEFAANVTLAPDEQDVVTISDVEIALDKSHNTQAQVCSDKLCVICRNDPAVCEQCTRGAELDYSTGTCSTEAGNAPGAVGSSASGTVKSCPKGMYWVGNADEPGSVYCNECNRPACSDCAFCDEAVYGTEYCWQNQYCVIPESGGRPCIEGYHFKNGGCVLCANTIPKCAFCDACPPTFPKCINGAQCKQCAQGYTIGPLGYCRLA